MHNKGFLNVFLQIVVRNSLAVHVQLDYYMAPPLLGMDVGVSPLEGTVIDLVPVVRIFGATPAGQKACLHLHKVHEFVQ